MSKSTRAAFVLLVLSNVSAFSLVMGQQQDKKPQPNLPGTYQIAIGEKSVYLLDTRTGEIRARVSYDASIGRRSDWNRLTSGIEDIDAQINGK